MNKSLTMQYYNKLRQINADLAKTKEGRSMIMKEAKFSTIVIPAIDYANNIMLAFSSIYKSFKINYDRT